MINDYKPNDFVAATLNSAGKLTLDDFKAYDLTPEKLIHEVSKTIMSNR